MDDIFIPNVFSPNGDDENDVLRVYGNFISGMELLIFNRWGEKVFHAKSQAEVWDGTFEGSGSLVFYNLGEGVDLGNWGDNVPQDVIDAVMEARDQYISGDLDPFVGPIVDADGVESLLRRLS